MLNEKDTRPVLREYTGTRLGLLRAIQGSYSAMISHCWVNEMTRHQEKLDVSMLCVLEVPAGMRVLRCLLQNVLCCIVSDNDENKIEHGLATSHLVHAAIAQSL